MGWFFGFKLHLITNDKGEILSYMITKGNIDDRMPVPSLCRGLFGKLFGDRGYISQLLSHKLLENGVQLFTRLKKNMKNKLMHIEDKILLRKRAIIESINDQLKNICQIEHTRHRSHTNFFANLISALIAYQLKSKKTSLNLNHRQINNSLTETHVRYLCLVIPYLSKFLTHFN